MTSGAHSLWVVRRALAMTPPEMALRIARAARDRAKRTARPRAQEEVARYEDVVASGVAVSPSRLLDDGAGSLLGGARDPEATTALVRELGGAARTIEEAEAVLDGRLAPFGGLDLDMGAPPAWLRDPVSGLNWPLVYWSLVDFRFDERMGDPRYVWEVNRAHHLLSLARAFALTGERRFADAIWRDVGSWIDANPPYFGVNWSSALEIGIRLMSWAAAVDITGSAGASEGDAERLLTSVSLQARHLSDNLSTYASSKNNHLIGEAAGLLTAGSKFPFLDGAERWAHAGRRVLERELAGQVSSDGVSKEQTFHYQAFVLEFCLMAEAAARCNGEPMSPAFHRTMGKMARFTRSVAGAGAPPSVGDEDGGKSYVLGGIPGRQAQSAAACAALVAGVPGAAGERPDDLEPAAWLFGPDAVRDRIENGGVEPDEGSAAFPDGGYFVAAAGNQRGVIDCGPLGYLSIAAHGHADCLSLSIANEGRWIVVDPGTYCYHREEFWRDHFRSTAAHNTVELDGSSQSEMLGPFMWGRRATARLGEWSVNADFDYFEGSHDGYVGSCGVIHRRSVVFRKRGYWVVVDRLEGSGHHDVRATFQFAPGFSVSEGGGVLLSRDGEDLALFDDLPAGVTAEIVEGRENPPAGWVSPEFGVMKAAPSYVASGNAELPATFVFVLAPSPNASVECVIEGAGSESPGAVVTVSSRDWSETILLGSPSRSGGVAFRGTVGVEIVDSGGRRVAWGLNVDDWKKDGEDVDYAPVRVQRRTGS